MLSRIADIKDFADIKDMVDTAMDSASTYAVNQDKVLIYVIPDVKKRGANPQASKSVLTMTLEGRDPQTGEGLSDDTIMYNVSLHAFSTLL